MQDSAVRRELLLEYLAQGSFMKVSELARRLRCSQMTVRRDLGRLEAEGFLKRSHGGASVSRQILLAFALEEKSRLEQRRKLAIGRAAAKMVQKGEEVLLGSGDTMVSMAQAMTGHEDVLTVTTSLGVVAMLLAAPGVQCMLAGGALRKESPDLYGTLLEKNLENMRTDKTFITADAVSREGVLSVMDKRIAPPTRLMMQGAGEVVVLLDSSSAQGATFTAFGNLADVDCLITDTGMPKEILDIAREAGVRTIIVNPEE